MPLLLDGDRGLRLWEVVLFIWAWNAGNLALAVGAGALAQLACGSHGLVVLLVVLAIEPLRGLERKSWAQAKASHRGRT